MYRTLDLGEFLDKKRDAKLEADVDLAIKDISHQYLRQKQSNGLAAFKAVVAAVDKAIADLPLREQLQHTCRKGCSACCHYDISIYPQEAELIARYCRKKKIEIDQLYLSKQASISHMDISASSTHSACVFLKDGQCSIYSVRPISCRKLLRINNPTHCDAKLFPRGSMESIVFTRFNLKVEIIISGIETAGIRANRMPALLLAELSKHSPESKNTK